MALGAAISTPQSANVSHKPTLSLSRIIEMNLGFFGLQFSFGLQQGNMAPIYSYLGAEEAALPLLQLAGPMTGLIVQPIIGAMSDRTDSRWGRRTPYFVIGAILCAFGLLFMPLAQSIVMAVSLLWILDAGNNITMEPYRAYVSDRLNEPQHSTGFLTQSAFTGLAQCCALGTPALLVGFFGIDRDSVGGATSGPVLEAAYIIVAILIGLILLRSLYQILPTKFAAVGSAVFGVVFAGAAYWYHDAVGRLALGNSIPDTVYIVFSIGAILSLSTILWSVLRVPELPLTAVQKIEISRQPKTVGATFAEIWDAIREMPMPMRKLGVMMLFQWYAMGIYWTYVTYSIARSVYGTTEAVSDGFRQAVLTNGTVGAFYNAIAFVSAIAMMVIVRKIGPRKVHAIALVCGGIAMLAIPQVTSVNYLFPAAIGIGICWGSIMGTPYIMLASCIPPKRTGVYMGIFNMMIVIPMLLNGFTFPLIYKPILGNDPRNAMMLGGVLLVCAAIAVMRVKDSELGTAEPEKDIFA
jgi:maltose/moltooligosaccharide transporter